MFIYIRCSYFLKNFVLSALVSNFLFEVSEQILFYFVNKVCYTFSDLFVADIDNFKIRFYENKN